MSSMFGPNKYARAADDDTGWVTIPLTDTTNFQVYAVGQDPKYRVVGNRVYFQGALGLLTATYVDSTTGRVFLTLPVQARPVSMLPVFVCQGSSLNRWALRIYQDGTCSAERYGPGASTGGTWLPFNVTWLND